MIVSLVHDPYKLEYSFTLCIFLYLFYFSVNELQEEGKNAIESPTSPTLPDIGPEGYQLGMPL